MQGRLLLFCGVEVGQGNGRTGEPIATKRQGQPLIVSQGDYCEHISEQLLRINNNLVQI